MTYARSILIPRGSAGAFHRCGSAGRAVRCSRCAPRNLRYLHAAASASLRLPMRAALAAHLPAVPARFASCAPSMACLAISRFGRCARAGSTASASTRAVRSQSRLDRERVGVRFLFLSRLDRERVGVRFLFLVSGVRFLFLFLIVTLCNVEQHNVSLCKTHPRSTPHFAAGCCGARRPLPESQSSSSCRDALP